MEKKIVQLIIEIQLQLNQTDRIVYQILDRKKVKLHNVHLQNDFDHHQQKHQILKLLLTKKSIFTIKFYK